MLQIFALVTVLIGPDNHLFSNQISLIPKSHKKGKKKQASKNPFTILYQLSSYSFFSPNSPLVARKIVNLPHFLPLPPPPFFSPPLFSRLQESTRLHFSLAGRIYTEIRNIGDAPREPGSAELGIVLRPLE